jgi:hypothetical protein
MPLLRLGICSIALLLVPVTAWVSTAASASRTSLRRVQRTSIPLAQIGWTTAVDEASGHTYYYNEQTGASQWEPPQSQWEPPQVATARQAPGAQAVWRFAGLSGVAGFDFTQDDPHYRTWGLHARSTKNALPYTLRSGDEQVLSRWNMVNQKLTVSRRQCTVRCHGDGVATLTSEGKGPTVWRENGGAWIALQKGDRVTLSDGDSIGLDFNDPDAAVFVCQLEGAMQLPYPWERVADPNGGAFYFNPQTGVSQWDPP